MAQTSPQHARLAQLRNVEHHLRQQIAALPHASAAYIQLTQCLVAQSRLKDALATLDAAPETVIRQTEVASLRAAVLFSLGEWQRAASAAREILILRPGDLRTSLLLASCHLELRQPREAVRAVRQVVEAGVNSKEALTILGISLAAAGDQEEALLVLHQAIERFDSAEAKLEAAKLFRLKGDGEAAIALLTPLAKESPSAQVEHELGMSWHAVGDIDRALHHVSRAHVLSPPNAALENDLGQLQFRAGNREAALAHYQRALELRPDMAVASANMGLLLAHAGDVADARVMLSRSHELDPLAGTRVTRDLLLPPVVESRAHITALRANYAGAIDQLEKDGVRLADPAREVFLSNFYLAYHGLDNKDLQQRLARYFLSACPSLTGIPGAEERARRRHQRDGKLRIGFFSLNIHHHSVALCFAEVVNVLSGREGFDVVLISTKDALAPHLRPLYAGFRGSALQVRDDLSAARNAIAEQALDILVFLDIGMDTLSYFLAFARLAPVQLVLGGHPDTTGVANLDYFISTSLAEPDDGDTHYSETLVRLPTATMQLRPEPLPTGFSANRAELGFADASHLYVCPMKLQKIHPDFDTALAEIVHRDPLAEVLLFEDDSSPVRTRALQARLDRTVPRALRSRIRFLPWQFDQIAFAKILGVSDVVLDPFHFGIGSTAMTVFSLHTPLVTWPGQFLRSRTGLYFSRVLDIAEMVAPTQADYVERAIQLASDRSANEAMRARLRERAHALFEETDSVRQFGDWLEQVARH
ncbi:MAG: tetratricopeptide repeat protein [Betaproteobacteria bacterium]|nr:tetratricopeptide repeat protein [Betaproteobacteria bacterium]